MHRALPSAGHRRQEGLMWFLLGPQDFFEAAANAPAGESAHGTQRVLKLTRTGNFLPRDIDNRDPNRSEVVPSWPSRACGRYSR